MHTVNLTCPTSWRELSQQQLRYVFYLLATFADLTGLYFMIQNAQPIAISYNQSEWT